MTIQTNLNSQKELSDYRKSLNTPNFRAAPQHRSAPPSFNNHRFSPHQSGPPLSDSFFTLNSLNTPNFSSSAPIPSRMNTIPHFVPRSHSRQNKSIVAPLAIPTYSAPKPQQNYGIDIGPHHLSRYPPPKNVSFSASQKAHPLAALHYPRQLGGNPQGHQQYATHVFDDSNFLCYQAFASPNRERTPLPRRLPHHSAPKKVFPRVLVRPRNASRSSIIDELNLMDIDINKGKDPILLPSDILRGNPRGKTMKTVPFRAQLPFSGKDPLSHTPKPPPKRRQASSAQKTGRKRRKKSFLLNKVVAVKNAKKKNASENYSNFSFDELLRKKSRIEQELAALQKNAGKLIKRNVSESNLKSNLWAKAVSEAKTFQNCFLQNYNEQTKRMRKVSKSIRNFKSNRANTKRKGVAEAEKRRRKKAKEISRLVKIGFWRKIQKLSDIKEKWHVDEKRRKIFKERLDSFVEQSATMGSQVAQQMTAKPIQTEPAADEKSAKSEARLTKMLDSVATQSSNPESPAGNTIAQCPVKTPSPPLMRHGELRDYQRIGLDWLVALNASGMNGILADEMGLGKTVQTIALLAHLASAKENWGPHLLVVPTSVLVNWEMEFKRWLPGFKVLAYYGTSKERKAMRRGWEEPNSFHVLITSYNLVVSDGKALRRKRWSYLVLDEAHHIKNFQSKKWQTMVGLRSAHRLLLTGTPLQNNVMELWSFLHFLMPKQFASRAEFTQWFDCPVADLLKRNQTLSSSPVVRSLHKILRPFMLRRLKSEVAQQLPRKTEVVVKCTLSLRQRRLYEDFMNEGSTKDILSRENFYGMWGVLMQLRKVCNHPDLFEGRAINSPLQMPSLPVETPAAFFGFLARVPLESVCADLMRSPGATGCDRIEDDATQRALGLLRCDEAAFVKLYTDSRQRSDGGDYRAELMKFLGRSREGEGLLWEKTQNCSSENGLVVGKGAGKVKKDSVSLHVWSQEQAEIRKDAIFKAENNKRKSSKNFLLYGESLMRLLYLNKKLIERENATNAAKNAIKLPRKRSKEMKKLLEHFVCINPPARAPPSDTGGETLLQQRISRNRNKRELVKAAASVRKKPLDAQRFGSEEFPLEEKLELLTEPLHLPHIRASMNFPDKRLIQWDCGKLQKLSALLSQHKQKGNRCLIFTQMTKMLDVLEAFLNIYNYRYFRLDGSTRTDRRGALMAQFNSDESIFAFILTTRSGGYGINLTGANVVIFYDTDWNPAMDMQAQDRAHRIGQTREVTIYRLISTNTVEENMFRVALNKRKVNKAVIGDGKFDSENLFRRSEVWSMFGVHKDADADGDEKMQISKMMNAAEDEEDRRTLEKAMESLKSEKMTAKEYAAEMEAELNGVECYALNYAETWVSMSGFGRAESVDEGVDTGEEPSEERENRRLKADPKRKTKSGRRGKRKASSGNGKRGEDKIRKPMDALLTQKFAILGADEQKRVLQHFTDLFHKKGFHVHDFMVNDSEKNPSHNPFEKSSLLNKPCSLVPITQIVQRTSFSKSIKIEPKTSPLVKKESTIEYKLTRAKKGLFLKLNKVLQKESKNAETDQNSLKTIKSLPKSVSDCNKKTVDILAKNGANGAALRSDCVQMVFEEDSVEVEKYVFGNLFPAEDNIDKINKTVKVLRSETRHEEEEFLFYRWKTCPPLPDISVFTKAENELKRKRDEKNLKLQNLHNNAMKKKNKKLTRKTLKTTFKSRKPAIIVREVVVKIPFYLLRKFYPRGWQTIKMRRIVSSTTKRVSAGEKSGSDDYFKKPLFLTSGLKQSFLKKETKLLYGVPVLWTRDEDSRLLQLYRWFGPNFELLSHALNSSERFYGRVRASADCKMRIAWISQSDINPSQRTKEGQHAVETFERQKVAVQEGLKQSFVPEEPARESKNFLRHEPATFGSLDTLALLRQAFDAVKAHRSACQGILKNSLGDLRASPSQETFFATLQEHLGSKYSGNFSEVSPLQIIKSENRVEPSVAKENLGSSSTQMWHFAVGLNNKPESLLVMGREKASHYLNNFIKSFKKQRPSCVAQLDSILKSQINNKDKVKSIANLYLRTSHSSA